MYAQVAEAQEMDQILAHERMGRLPTLGGASMVLVGSPRPELFSCLDYGMSSPDVG